MTALLRQMQAAAKAAQTLAEVAGQDPSRRLRWLPGQHRFLSSPASRKLYRTGNQHSGKTTAALYEVICRCLGRHPFLKVRPPPIEAWVICATWSQSIAIQGKCHALLPEGVLDTDETPFDELRGFRGKNPAAKLRNGSIIRFKTTQQGGLSLAGSTIDVALFDEPPTSPRIYEEVKKRTLRRGGVVLLSMTPVNAGPMDWLRELVEAGQIEDIHQRLTPEAMIPVGAREPIKLDDGTVCDAAWVERILADTMPHEVPVVIHGEWEFRTLDRVFAQFKHTTHVSAEPLGGTARVHLGIDYSTRVGKQVALLVLVDDRGEHDRIMVLDESVGTDTTTIEEDARGVLEMLTRNGIRWEQIDEAYGDRALNNGPAVRKSNADLLNAIQKRLGRVPTPTIRTVKRGVGHGRGSVDIGCRYLHQAMLRPGHFRIHPRCTYLIEAIDKWRYEDDGFKDHIDALRYALDSRIFTGRGNLRIAPVRLY